MLSLPWHSERALYVGIIACDVIHTNIMSHLLCGPRTVFMNFCVNPELCYLVYHGYVRGLDFFGGAFVCVLSSSAAQSNLVQSFTVYCSADHLFN